MPDLYFFANISNGLNAGPLQGRFYCDKSCSPLTSTLSGFLALFLTLPKRLPWFAGLRGHRQRLYDQYPPYCCRSRPGRCICRQCGHAFHHVAGERHRGLVLGGLGLGQGIGLHGAHRAPEAARGRVLKTALPGGPGLCGLQRRCARRPSQDGCHNKRKQLTHADLPRFSSLPAADACQRIPFCSKHGAKDVSKALACIGYAQFCRACGAWAKLLCCAP